MKNIMNTHNINRSKMVFLKPSTENILTYRYVTDVRNDTFELYQFDKDEGITLRRIRDCRLFRHYHKNIYSGVLIKEKVSLSFVRLTTYDCSFFEKCCIAWDIEGNLWTLNREIGGDVFVISCDGEERIIAKNSGLGLEDNSFALVYTLPFDTLELEGKESVATKVLRSYYVDKPEWSYVSDLGMTDEVDMEDSEYIYMEDKGEQEHQKQKWKRSSNMFKPYPSSPFELNGEMEDLAQKFLQGFTVCNVDEDTNRFIITDYMI